MNLESFFEHLLCFDRIESFSLTLRCTYEHVETGVRMVAASKQLAIIQPVLTGTELEFVNSIV